MDGLNEQRSLFFDANHVRMDALYSSTDAKPPKSKFFEKHREQPYMRYYVLDMQ